VRDIHRAALEVFAIFAATILILGMGVVTLAWLLGAL